ncbi:MAG: amidohydrolase family protein [Acidobacteriota bacterium]
MTAKIYKSEWVLPITSPPIHQGAIAVDGEQLVFVGRQNELASNRQFPNVEVKDFGRAAILPGLINTHTHLELTLMRGFLEDLPFRDWILKLTKTKYERLTIEDLQASALLGAAEALRAGITCVADTGDSRAPMDAMRQSGLRGIAYREVFGPDAAMALQALADLKAKVAEMRDSESERVSVGVSPHAPYTVSAELFRHVVEFAAREVLDVAIHTAESSAESDLLMSGTGDFAERLALRGIEWQSPRTSTIKYFAALGVLDVQPLLIHCVQVDDEDIELLSRSRSRIAHCPKSNAKLGHGIAPLAKFLNAGIRVGLGTDSVASNNRLDLLNEANLCALVQRAAAKNFNEPTVEQMFRLMTIDGARALNLENQIGSLEIGKQADVIAVDLSATHNAPLHDAMAAILFSATSSDVRMTMVAGRVLYADGEIQSIDESRVASQVNLALPKLID